MLLLSLWLAKDMVEEADARGEPFTVKKAFIDVLEVTAVMLILAGIIIIAEIIINTPNIRGTELVPIIYVCTGATMVATLIGYFASTSYIEHILSKGLKK